MKMIAESKKMKDILNLIDEIANINVTVLISGESGTGKEVIAQLIHSKSESRSINPLISVNCAAIPANLIESELFGYQKGAFTGANQKHTGKFEQANHGTLFLDEIGDLNFDVQAKLLRTLQDKKVIPVGGTAEILLDIRLICATNKNLDEMVLTNLFRSDLYYRINVIQIELPPLRERKEDIVPLVYHYLEKYTKEFKKDSFSVSRNAIHFLESYEWPGNIRELQNVLQKVIISKKGGEIDLNDFPQKMIENHDKNSELLKSFQFIYDEEKIDLAEAVNAFEKKIIMEVYEKCNKNQRKTARMLNIGLSVLQYKLKKFDL